MRLGLLAPLFSERLHQFGSVLGERLPRQSGHGYLHHGLDCRLLITHNRGHKTQLRGPRRNQQLGFSPLGGGGGYSHTAGYVIAEKRVERRKPLLKIRAFLIGQRAFATPDGLVFAAEDKLEGNAHFLVKAGEIRHLHDDAYAAHLAGGRRQHPACGRRQPVRGGGGKPVHIRAQRLDLAGLGNIVGQLLGAGNHAARRIDGKQHGARFGVFQGLRQRESDGVLPCGEDFSGPPAALRGTVNGAVHGNDSHTVNHPAYAPRFLGNIQRFSELDLFIPRTESGISVGAENPFG